MAKTTGTDSVNTTDVVLFDSTLTGKTCRRWTMATDAATLVNVAPIHAAEEYFPLSAGESITFEGNITRVVAKTAVGTANVRHGIVAA